MLYAVKNDNLETCKALIAAGADPTIENNKGESALSESVLSENSVLVDYFRQFNE